MRALFSHLLPKFLRPAAFVAALSCSCAVARADGSLLDVVGTNITDVLGDLRGGLKRGLRALDKADITATFLGDDHGATGFSSFVDGQITTGNGFSGYLAGDAQGVSSIDAPASVRLANAWIAQDLGGKGGLKAGVIDLNTEFDVQTTAALFLNSAFGVGSDFSQSGRNGPSIFPSTGLGLAGWWLPGDHWQVKAGVFEGTPGDPAHPGRTRFSFAQDEGALLVMEVRNHLTPGFVVGAGAWRYTVAFDAIDPARGRLTGNSGFYAIADGLLYADPQGENTGLSGWLRAGVADGRINAIASTIGGGLVYTGPFGRRADQAGIALARAQFGNPVRQAVTAGGGSLEAAETTLEATYSFNINAHLTIQPDFQYVISPSGDPSLDNALILGSRFIATW